MTLGTVARACVSVAGTLVGALVESAYAVGVGECNTDASPRGGYCMQQTGEGSVVDRLGLGLGLG